MCLRILALELFSRVLVVVLLCGRFEGGRIQQDLVTFFQAIGHDTENVVTVTENDSLTDGLAG